MAFIHTQSIAEREWNIQHQLDTLNPVVDVWVETADGTTLIIPSVVRVVDANKVQIIFNSQVAGHTIIN
jgi:hypothetical protein